MDLSTPPTCCDWAVRRTSEALVASWTFDTSCAGLTCEGFCVAMTSLNCAGLVPPAPRLAFRDSSGDTTGGCTGAKKTSRLATAITAATPYCAIAIFLAAAGVRTDETVVIITQLPAARHEYYGIPGEAPPEEFGMPITPKFAGDAFRLGILAMDLAVNDNPMRHLSAFDYLQRNWEPVIDLYAERFGSTRDRLASSTLDALCFGGMAPTETFDPKRYTPFSPGLRPDQVLSTFPSIDTAVDHIKFTQGLEQIASSYAGVEKVFAMQAGREVRVGAEKAHAQPPSFGAIDRQVALVVPVAQRVAEREMHRAPRLARGLRRVVLLDREEVVPERAVAGLGLSVRRTVWRRRGVQIGLGALPASERRETRQ